MSILTIKVSKLPTMHPIYGYYDIVECVRITAICVEELRSKTIFLSNFKKDINWIASKPFYLIQIFRD